MKPIYLYRLIAANRKRITYVGVAHDVRARFYHHRMKMKWASGFQILDQATSYNWRREEKFWIAFFRKEGFTVKNRNDGGGGPRTLSQEHKAKISEWSRARIGNGWKIGFTEESRKRMSDRLRGKPLTLEHRAAIGAGVRKAVKEGRFNKRYTPQAKAKMKQTMIAKGHWRKGGKWSWNK
jgi:hypothetical protein